MNTPKQGQSVCEHNNPDPLTCKKCNAPGASVEEADWVRAQDAGKEWVANHYNPKRFPGPFPHHDLVSAFSGGWEAKAAQDAARIAELERKNLSMNLQYDFVKDAHDFAESKYPISEPRDRVITMGPDQYVYAQRKAFKAGVQWQREHDAARLDIERESFLAEHNENVRLHTELKGDQAKIAELEANARLHATIVEQLQRAQKASLELKDKQYIAAVEGRKAFRALATRYKEALEKTFEILDRVKPLAPEPGSGALFCTDKQGFDDRMQRAQDMVEAKAFIREVLRGTDG